MMFARVVLVEGPVGPGDTPVTVQVRAHRLAPRRLVLHVAGAYASPGYVAQRVEKLPSSGGENLWEVVWSPAKAGE